MRSSVHTFRCAKKFILLSKCTILRFYFLGLLYADFDRLSPGPVDRITWKVCYESSRASLVFGALKLRASVYISPANCDNKNIYIERYTRIRASTIERKDTNIWYTNPTSRLWSKLLQINELNSDRSTDKFLQRNYNLFSHYN